MTEFPHQYYAFGPFRLDVVKHLLLHNDLPVALPSKAFEMLLALVEQRGRVLEKEELLRRVWPDQIVEEANLTVNMSALRKALGERAGEHQYILTIPGRGYRFVAEVRGVEEARAEPVVERATISRVIVGDEGADAQQSIEDGAAGRKVLPPDNEGRAMIGRAAEPGALAHHQSEELAATTVAADRPVRNRRHWGYAVVVGLICAGVLAAAAIGFYRLFGSKVPVAPFQAMKITRLTTNGRAVDASISPDGRYVVYATSEDEGQSLWLKQISAESNVQITPPADVAYAGLTFSRDGESIYYVLYEKKHPSGALYQLPLFGGGQRKLMDHVNSPVTFSPDGKHLAFMRTNPGQEEITLMLGNADGTEVRKLASRKDGFSQGGPAWSPDGRVIACGAGAASGGYYVNVIEVRVEDGGTRLITSHEWADVNRLAWLADGSGLVLSAVDRDSWELPQLWSISYPSGEVTRITNDLNKYARSSLSLTGDSGAIVTLQSQLISNIWVAPDGDAGRARQVTFGSVGKYDGLYGLSWTPDGRIVYGAFSGYSQVIWIMNADGTRQKQLTPEGYVESLPVVTLDGRYIVFHSKRTGRFNIWRVDIDGSNLRQLTLSGDNFQPHCSTDSQWVVYMSLSAGNGTVWKVHIDGGEPVRLTDKPSSWPIVSPDGKLIACSYFDEQVSPNKRLAVIPFEGGRPFKTFELPLTATLWNSLRWAPDGSALDYRDTRRGLWRQPLAGGTPEKLPTFETELIHNFSWSRDGKQLVVTRGPAVNDIILIRNFR